MTQTPATTRTVFPDISSRAWEHPADRTALTALRRLKGFDQVLKVISAMLRERQHRLLYLASSAQVGPRQFADLDALLDECVQVLDAPNKPGFFVSQSPDVNAYAIGMDTPFIVVTSGMYEMMSHDEMRFVIGHELGHALSGHAVYRTMLMHLMRLHHRSGSSRSAAGHFARSSPHCWNGNGNQNFRVTGPDCFAHRISTPPFASS